MAENDMNAEQERLKTFNNYIQWRSNRLVSKEILARNGWFATGHCLETQCHWCKILYSGWEREQNHRALENIAEGHASNCVFVLRSDACGNIPLERPTEMQQEDVDLYQESNRLATFKNWPNSNISPQSLAKAGFYYLNRSDEVKCAWCHGVIAQWERQDNAFEEHKRFFPECPRVQLGPHVEWHGGSSGLCDLGIQRPTPPKKPKYSSLDARLRTFAKWPISHVQHPEALAQAGLYYQDVDDQVRCFHCNIGLRSWQKEDEPWFEHAKWHPQCQFVQLAKGLNYIKEVQMSLSPARQALEIGIDGGTVQAVIQRRIHATGCPFENLDDLLQAVFEPHAEHVLDEKSDGMACCSAFASNATTNTESLAQGEQPNTVLSSGSLLEPATSTALVLGIEKSRNVSIPPVATQDVLEKNQSRKAVVEDTISLEKTKLEEENRQLKDARLCKVCLDEEVGVVFLPCGHLVTCMQCAPGVQHCPMCRASIKGFVRAFLS